MAGNPSHIVNEVIRCGYTLVLRVACRSDDLKLRHDHLLPSVAQPRISHMLENADGADQAHRDQDEPARSTVLPLAHCWPRAQHSS